MEDTTSFAPDLIYDLCVIGAGPVGATLACHAAASGLRVAVIDRAPLPPMQHPDFDGRAYAIAASSRQLLEQAGIWKALPLPVCPIEDIRVSDGKLGRRASRLHLHFDHRDIGAPFGYMVEARSLRAALNQRLKDQDNLTLFAPAACKVATAPDHATVAIAGGPVLRCKLVAAADGRDSALRRQAGIGVTTLRYDQVGIVCSIAHDAPHHGLALEHFLPGGPFAQLPMAGDAATPHRSGIVWTERGAQAARILALPDDAFIKALAVRLGSHLGSIRLEGKRWHYPLTALHAHRYYAQRLALVGDSAHGVHPIAGQGLNLGFRDVAVLAELLRNAIDQGADPGDTALLQRYQALRRPDNLMMLAATDVLDRLFSNNNPVLRLGRDLGLAAVERLPRVKRFFMRQAMGSPATGGDPVPPA